MEVYQLCIILLSRHMMVSYKERGHDETTLIIYNFLLKSSHCIVWVLPINKRSHNYKRIMLIWYNNFLLKYALWTGVVGAHLVGRCVLYSYFFLDPLIRLYTTGMDETWGNLLDRSPTMWNLSKLNASSKRALGREYEVSEDAIQKI